MPLTTVTVSIAALQVVGSALPYGRVRFELTAADIDDGIVVPMAQSVSLGADGTGTIELWPNSRGTQGTQYRVMIYSRSGDLQESELATVPETDCNLHDILELQAPAVVDDAQAAATAAQGYAAAASTSSGAAAASASGASTSATSAASSAAAAATSQAAAATSASAAQASEDAVAHIYAGTYSSAPTTRPDGSAIQNGDIYVSTANAVYTYVSGVWAIQTAASTLDLASQTDATKGTALVGHRRTTVQKSIDQLKREAYKPGAMLRFWRAMNTLLQGTTTQIPVMSFGDSVAGYNWTGLTTQFINTVGQAGCALGEFSTGDASSPTQILTGGAASNNGTTVPYDYTYWPTGIHTSIPAAGTATFLVSGAVFTGTKFAIYYAKRSGGGTMTVDLLDASNVVQATSGVIDTSNATTDYGKYEFTVTAAARKLKVTCNSGTVIVVGSKFLHTGRSGVVFVGLNRGGLGLDQVNTAAAAIWKGCIADLSPVFATYMGRETESTVYSQLTTFLTAYNLAYASTDWLLCGCWAFGSGGNDDGLAQNDQPSYQENMEVKRVADAFGYEFFDVYSLFRGPAITKSTPSNVHLDENDALFMSAAFINLYGFNQLVDGKGFTKEGWADDFYRSPVYAVNGGNPYDTNALTVEASGTRDALLNLDRTLTLYGNALVTPVQLLKIEGAASVPGLMYHAYYNTNSKRNATDYSTNGDWALVMDSSRNLYLRAMIGGALYSTHLFFGDPGVDVSGNIDNSKGFGLRAKLFGSSDLGFTDPAEYKSEEIHFARNATTQELEIKFLGSSSLRSIRPLAVNGASQKAFATVSTGAVTGATNFDAGTSATLYRTTNASGNWTLNFRWSSTVSLDTAMATGDSLTLSHRVTQGGTAYYPTAFTIDGNAVTPKWLGGSAPAAGNVSSVDVYTYNIIKTAAATFVVFASQQRYA